MFLCCPKNLGQAYQNCLLMMRRQRCTSWTALNIKSLLYPYVQGSFSGAISRYSRIFCMKSHTNSWSEKKIALWIFLISRRKVSFTHMPSISRHSDYSARLVFGFVCATICFLYNYCQSLRSVPLGRFVVKIICRSLFFCVSSSVTSLNQHKKQLKMSSDTTKENCLSQRRPVGMVTCWSTIISPTTPTFFLFW